MQLETDLRLKNPRMNWNRKRQQPLTDSEIATNSRNNVLLLDWVHTHTWMIP